MRIRTIVAVLAMTAPVMCTGSAFADDPNQGGPPLYCSNSAPYPVDQQNAHSRWNVWMADCYHAYEILPPGRRPSQSACSQVWDGGQGQFQIMTHDEFMGICANPYPY